MNVLQMEGKKVLLQPEAAEAANQANIVIGDPRAKETDKVIGRRVTVSRQPGGGEVIKITIPNSALGGQDQEQSRPPSRFVKPKNPEVGRRKVNEASFKHKRTKPALDMLMSKYARSANARWSDTSPTYL